MRWSQMYSATPSDLLGSLSPGKLRETSNALVADVPGNAFGLA